MAVVPYTITHNQPDVWVVQWIGLANGDSGQPYQDASKSDRSVQIDGTFGVGGNVVLEGTNDPTAATYLPVTDPQGNALSTITSNRIEQVMEDTYGFRPRVSAGDSNTSLNVRFVVVRG